MDDSPCPYIYDDGTNLFLDEGFELHCQNGSEDYENVTKKIVSLRKNDGARYDKIIDLAVEVVGFSPKHREGVQNVLGELKKNQSR